jgi:TRAP-type mannitol/chloroaromatic compound transport system permease small subunit
LRRLLEWIALTSGWLLVIMACVTTFDVVARKFGMELPFTKLQELEWHFHAAIFSLWMGLLLHHQRASARRFLHRKDDASRQGLGRADRLPRAGAALHRAGFLQQRRLRRVVLSDERAVRQHVGLTHRWIIKGVYAAGLWLVLLGIVSVLLRVIVFLFGNKPDEEVNLQIGHVETEV